MISVLLPVFNAERHLNECLESICGSPYAKLEICIVDDGSTDRSPAILRRWLHRDPRIQLVTQRRHGVAGARNALLRLASGDLLVLHDADDLSHRERFGRIATSYLEENWDLFHSRSFLINDNDEIRGATHVVQPFAGWLRRGHCQVVHGSVALRRSALEVVGSYRDIGAEDLDLWLRFVAAGMRIHYCREPLYARRIHARSVVARSNEELHSSAAGLADKRGPIGVPRDLSAYYRLKVGLISGDQRLVRIARRHPIWAGRLLIVQTMDRQLARAHRSLAPGFDRLVWAA